MAARAAAAAARYGASWEQLSPRHCWASAWFLCPTSCCELWGFLSVFVNHLCWYLLTACRCQWWQFKKSERHITGYVLWPPLVLLFQWTRLVDMSKVIYLNIHMTCKTTPCKKWHLQYVTNVSYRHWQTEHDDLLNLLYLGSYLETKVQFCLQY